MKFRPICILLTAFPLAASAAETVAPAAPKPSVMQRLLNPFGGAPAPAAPTPSPAPPEAKEAGPKTPKKKSGPASSALKRPATPAPATPKPSVIDRLLHPFSEPATTEPSAAPTAPAAPAAPVATKDASPKSPRKGAGAAAPAPATPKPSVMHRLLHPFGGPAAPEATKDASLKNLEMGAGVEPPAPRLSETREVKVTVTLANKGRKLAQLAFPTNQRIEVLLKDKTGRKLVQWSEDQAFFAEPTLITINPGERLEYAATVSTRDLVAGETYTLEAFFPNLPELHRTLGLAPVK